jgi:hypothetical protein
MIENSITISQGLLMFYILAGVLAIALAVLFIKTKR